MSNVSITRPSGRTCVASCWMMLFYSYPALCCETGTCCMCFRSHMRQQGLDPDCFLSLCVSQWFFLCSFCQDVQLHGRWAVLRRSWEHTPHRLHGNRLLDAVPSLQQLHAPGPVAVLCAGEMHDTHRQHWWGSFVSLHGNRLHVLIYMYQPNDNQSVTPTPALISRGSSLWGLSFSGVSRVDWSAKKL